MKVPRKSQDDIYVDLCCKLLADLSNAYPQKSQSFSRDALTVRQRVAAEGLSFLTKTLPKLGKAIDRSLETRTLSVPEEFKRSHENSSIPAFLAGLLSDAFDSDGNLVKWDPVRLYQARQVCFLLYKLELPYSPDQEASVLQSFKETDHEIGKFWLPYDERFFVVAREVVAEVLEGFDPKDILPRHGPGAVSTSEKGEQKWTFSRLYDAIHQEFPYYEYFVVGGAAELVDRIKWYRGLSRLETGSAKVVLVPKDSRGPRLISCEPLEYQWIQQGLGRKLMQHLESFVLTRGNINFERQDVNRDLAQVSSLTGEYATIDLKDASDRVSLQLVEYLIPTRVYKALRASRSEGTLLPDGSVLPLNKFAPMGSALCFPVEALLFWSICVSAISTLSGQYYRRVAHLVKVYGDDIIVPVEYFEEVVRALELCGLRVNRDKCFHQGDFRESCGMDAYLGVDVTPIRIHTLWSGKPSDGSALTSWTAYANELCARGWFGTSGYMFDLVDRLYGKLPYGTETSGFPCRTVDSWFVALIKNIEKGFKLRSNECTGEVQVYCKYLRPKTSDTALDSWERLLRNIVMPDPDSPSKVTHSRSVQLRTGWKRL